MKQTRYLRLWAMLTILAALVGLLRADMSGYTGTVLFLSVTLFFVELIAILWRIWMFGRFRAPRWRERTVVHDLIKG